MNYFKFEISKVSTCKDIRVGQFEFVTITQFLKSIITGIMKILHGYPVIPDLQVKNPPNYLIVFAIYHFVVLLLHRKQ